MLTLQSIINYYHFNTAWMFLQNKTRDAYVNAFDGLKDACQTLLNQILKPSRILLDFETGMQQALLLAFFGVILKGILFYYNHMYNDKN